MENINKKIRNLQINEIEKKESVMFFRNLNYTKDRLVIYSLLKQKNKQNKRSEKKII